MASHANNSRCWWEFFCLAAWRMKSVSCRQTRRMQPHAFPDPTDFFGVKAQSLKSLGFSANKSQALLDVSSAIRDRRLNLESLV